MVNKAQSMGKLLVAFAWLPCALSLGCGETLRLGERPDAGAPIADASDVSPQPPSSSRPTPPVSLEPLEPIAERGVTDARAAFDGERAMIVWSRPSTTEPLYEISAARYDADGTLLDPQPLRLGIGRHFGVAPRETGGFLVVWTDAAGEVVYRNVERDGTLVLPQRVIDAGAAGSDLGLDFVAYRLGFYLVRLRAEGYIEQALAPAADGSLVCRDFCGVRVSAGDGQFVGGVRLAESASGLSVYVARRRADGTAAIERRNIHGGAPVELVRAQALADVVAGSQSTLLTWYGDRNRLLGARLDSATDALLDTEPIELSEVGQTTSAAVASSAGFAIALSGSQPQAKLLPEEGGPATTLLQDILLSDTLDAVALGPRRALLVGRGWLDDTLAATLLSLA
ncbi:MAG: hypothetical protein K8H88_05925, partial [Sandaracinaceae bacterium]|nr:hypothetical protein [Sandaracinaceae bacterium]